MTHPGGSFTAEELLEHASFLSGLARELIGDSHAAEDAVQEAYVTALERPPRASGSLRGWLAVVTSNLARNARRGGQRRYEREHAAARPEREEPGERALERLDVQRVLLELLRELPEEQRTVLVLRYYEDRTPSEIAAQLGAPVKTIKTRHTRAVAALRARLDERAGGEREAWVSALLPWARRASVPASAAGGGLALGVAVVLVAVSALVWWNAAGPRASAPVSGERVAKTDVPPSVAASGPARVKGEPSAAVVPTRPVALEGVVRLKEDDSPVAGVTVEALERGRERAQAPATTTDALGRFRLEWPAPLTLVSVEVRGADATTGATQFLNQRLSPGQTRSIELWVTHGATLEGTVVDASGAPVPFANVSARDGRDFRPERPLTHVARARGDGTFVLEHLGPQFTLVAEAPGLVSTDGLRGELVAGTRASGLELRLGEAATIRGHVTDEDGRPLAGAELHIRPHMSSSDRDATLVAGVQCFDAADAHATSDASGAFALGPVPRRSWNARVTHPAFLFRDARVDPELADNRIALAAGEQVRGVVYGADGQPLAGARVRIVPHEGEEQRTTTADDGRFVLSALGEVEKGFLFVQAPGHAPLALQPLALAPSAGGEHHLRLSPPVRLAGRVVDATGQAVVDALVRVRGDRLVDYGGTDFGEPTTWEWVAERNETRTDAAGRFEFAELYDGEFEVQASPADELDLHAVVTVRSGGDDVELVVDRAALAHVVFSGTVLDAETRQPVREFQVSRWRADGNGTTRAFGAEAAGRFRLPGNDAGAYALSVSAPGYAPWREDERDYRWGETALDVRLSPACAVELVVRDARGLPLNQTARVEFHDLEGRALWIQWGNGSSSSALDVGQKVQVAAGLPRAPVRLTATCPGYEDAALDLDLTVPPTAPVEIAMQLAR